MANPPIKDKEGGSSVQNILAKVLNRVSKALRVIAYGYDGFNYQAIKTDTNGVVKVCDVQGAGGSSSVAQYVSGAAVTAGQKGIPAMGTDGSQLFFVKMKSDGTLVVSAVGAGVGVTRVSSDILSGQVTRVSADILGTPDVTPTNLAVCALYIRPGTGATFGLAAGVQWAGKVSAQVLNPQTTYSRVSADVLSGMPTRVSADILSDLIISKVSDSIVAALSAGANWVGKISAQVLNQVTTHSRVSADILGTPTVNPQNIGASALFIRPGISATWQLGAGTAWAAKVSAQVLNPVNTYSRVSADVLSDLPLAKGTDNILAALSATTNWVGKVSAQVLNRVTRVSADVLSDKTYTMLQASAALNAAGSATFVAASAGVTYRIGDYVISSYADNAKFAIKIGTKKITPWIKTKDGGGISHKFFKPVSVVAACGIKLSSTAASGQAMINYYK